jgi:hypothetical protein
LSLGYGVGEPEEQRPQGSRNKTMLTLFAVISGQAVIQAIIYLIVFGLIFWLLWWLLNYIALPEPFNKFANVLLALGAVIVLINLLLSLVGKGFIEF